MSVDVTVSGSVYSLPTSGDPYWRPSVTAWAQAVSSAISSLSSGGISKDGTTTTTASIPFAQGLSSNSTVTFEAIEVVTDTGVGLKIATAPDQKLAFHGNDPVEQRSGKTQAAVPTTTPTNISPYGYSKEQATDILTLLNEIREVLVEKGLMKGEA